LKPSKENVMGRKWIRAVFPDAAEQRRREIVRCKREIATCERELAVQQWRPAVSRRSSNRRIADISRWESRLAFAQRRLAVLEAA
jgi:hypothetical protein